MSRSATGSKVAAAGAGNVEYMTTVQHMVYEMFIYSWSEGSPHLCRTRLGPFLMAKLPAADLPNWAEVELRGC